MMAAKTIPNNIEIAIRLIVDDFIYFNSQYIQQIQLWFFDNNLQCLFTSIFKIESHHKLITGIQVIL